jgi:hypothetical protein
MNRSVSEDDRQPPALAVRVSCPRSEWWRVGDGAGGAGAHSRLGTASGATAISALDLGVCTRCGRYVGDLAAKLSLFGLAGTVSLLVGCSAPRSSPPRREPGGFSSTRRATKVRRLGTAGRRRTGDAQPPLPYENVAITVPASS